MSADIALPLIEDKIGIGFGFAGVYPDQRCAVARNFSRHGATKPQHSPRLFKTASAGVREQHGAITIFQRS
jgi:hypothetical protein